VRTTPNDDFQVSQILSIIERFVPNRRFLKQLINEYDEEVRKSEEYKREGRGFDLSEKSMGQTIKSILKKLRAPTNKLKTGIQFLNKMLNGGLESGRSYMFMGLTGVGKSIVLMSIAMWIRKYNKLPKKEGVQYAVLFISQENSVTESFERMFNISISGDDIQSKSDEEIFQMLKDNGMLCNTDTDNINFIFKFFNDREIGVGDIDKLIFDYQRKGTEVIAVVQDYIEKLKPKYKFNEMRHSLGSVATELSELAKKWQIPVISAAQLNRAALTVVDNAIANNKKNTTKMLGKQNVSESWDRVSVPSYSNISVKMYLIVGEKRRGLYLYLLFKYGCLRALTTKLV
jgi:replicative DNA helicase